MTLEDKAEIAAKKAYDKINEEVLRFLQKETVNGKSPRKVNHLALGIYYAIISRLFDFMHRHKIDVAAMAKDIIANVVEANTKHNDEGGSSNEKD